MRTSKTTTNRRPTSAFGLVLAAIACGCAGPNTAPAAAPTDTAIGDGSHESDDRAAADLVEHDSHHHYGGLPMLVAMSLETLGVDPGQQLAVNEVRANLYRRMQPARAAEQALLQALADGVAADLIDASRVDDALARLASAKSTLSGSVPADLSQLHSVLKPEQRAALVDKVEAHWMLWQRANGEAPSGPPSRARLDRLTAELGLTPTQVEKVRAGLDAVKEGSRPMAFEEIEARVRAFESFRGDSFDPEPLASDDPGAHLASWGAARMARFFETLNPVLTSDQRIKLADMLREHASHTEEEQPS
jgi:hypothetical protein